MVFPVDLCTILPFGVNHRWANTRQLGVAGMALCEDVSVAHWPPQRPGLGWNFRQSTPRKFPLSVGGCGECVKMIPRGESRHETSSAKRSGTQEE
jgi:hypothetical protein